VAARPKASRRQRAATDGDAAHRRGELVKTVLGFMGEIASIDY
jgi:hypothetical protein